VLGPASGLQSYQYRAIEFILGNKQKEMLDLFAHDEMTQHEPRPRPYRMSYALCEKLVDIDEHFQLWRFRHVKNRRTHHRL
jgi:tryptophan 2,3-dioxygenase